MDIPNIKDYQLYKVREHYLGLNQEHPRARAEYYQNETGTFSIGLYYIDDQKLFIACGPKGSCEYHALLFTDPQVIGPGCVNFTLTENKIIFSEEENTFTYLL